VFTNLRTTDRVLSAGVPQLKKPINTKITFFAGVLLAMLSPLGHGHGLGTKLWEVDFHKPAFPGGNETPGTIFHPLTMFRTAAFLLVGKQWNLMEQLMFLGQPGTKLVETKN